MSPITAHGPRSGPTSASGNQRSACTPALQRTTAFREPNRPTASADASCTRASERLRTALRQPAWKLVAPSASA